MRALSCQCQRFLRTAISAFPELRSCVKAMCVQGRLVPWKIRRRQSFTSLLNKPCARTSSNYCIIASYNNHYHCFFKNCLHIFAIFNDLRSWYNFLLISTIKMKIYWMLYLFLLNAKVFAKQSRRNTLCTRYVYRVITTV